MTLSGKKILVTGGSGFVGSHVIQKLIEHGVPKGNIFTPSSADHDLREKNECKAVVRDQDVVIHLAATTGNTDFHLRNPGKIFFDNIMMGVELMEAARVAGIKKFISIGSITEYPRLAPVPFKEDDLWNGYVGEVNVPYSYAKKMLLVQGQAYRKQYGFNAIHLLPTNMYGPGEKPETAYVITALIKRILAAKSKNDPSVEVWGTGVATRDFLYIEDAAEGIVLAAEHYNSPEPVNMGSGEEISIKKIVEMISRIIGFQGKIHWDASKPNGDLRRVLDIHRAHDAFGFRAQTTLEDGLKKTIEWYREHPENSMKP